MVKILLLSDTHNYIDRRMIAYIKEADEVWHAGDIGKYKLIRTIKKYKPVRAVCGNIDDVNMQKTFPLIDEFTVESLKVFMTHIGGYPGRYTKQIKDKLTANPPDLFISGHSHILRVMYDKKLKFLHINPGAAGIEGFHYMRTMVRFEIDDNQIKNLEVIELGKRG